MTTLTIVVLSALFSCWALLETIAALLVGRPAAWGAAAYAWIALAALITERTVSVGIALTASIALSIISAEQLGQEVDE